MCESACVHVRVCVSACVCACSCVVVRMSVCVFFCMGECADTHHECVHVRDVVVFEVWLFAFCAKHWSGIVHVVLQVDAL